MTADRSPIAIFTRELVVCLESCGLTVRPPASRHALEQARSVVGTTLPADLTAFLRTVDGMEPGEYEPVSFMRLWPAEELCASDDTRHVVFADFLIWSHAYAIDASRGHVVLLGPSGPYATVATSFTDFLRRCLHDPYSLL